MRSSGRCTIRKGHKRSRLSKLLQKKKLAMQLALTAKRAVNTVRKVDDLFNHYAISHYLTGTKFDSVCLTQHRKLSEHDELVSWMLSCAKELKPAYEQSMMGWDEDEKLRELCDPLQRVIIAYHCKEHFTSEVGATPNICPHNDVRVDNPNATRCDHAACKGNRVGFLSFRWDVDENRPAMYVYELYVAPHARKHGVAAALMRLAEQICIAARIPLILLTVFDLNAAAHGLYQKLRYVALSFPSHSSIGID